MEERESLEYLVGLGEVKTLVIDEQTYSTSQIYSVKQPSPAALKTTTLTALVDYLKNNSSETLEGELIVHVVSPSEVMLYSSLRKDKSREAYMMCNALTPRITFDNFIDVEIFNIMLQSSFVDTCDKENLLKVTRCIKEEGVKEVGDDGVSQAVTIKTGIAKVGEVLLPNPVILAPYRTFPEIDQVESKFVFRMKEGPRAAIFEADGGAWRNSAMQNIKEYLEEQLKDLDFVNVIS